MPAERMMVEGQEEDEVYIYEQAASLQVRQGGKAAGPAAARAALFASRL